MWPRFSVFKTFFLYCWNNVKCSSHVKVLVHTYIAFPGGTFQLQSSAVALKTGRDHCQCVAKYMKQPYMVDMIEDGVKSQE